MPSPTGEGWDADTVIRDPDFFSFSILGAHSASSTSPRWNLATILARVNKPAVALRHFARRRGKAGLRTPNVLSLEFRDGSDTVWDRTVGVCEIQFIHVPKV